MIGIKSLAGTLDFRRYPLGPGQCGLIDAFAVLALWAATVGLAVFVEPHRDAPLSEILYQATFNVVIGWAIGFRLFDRLGGEGPVLLAVKAGCLILGATTANETLVGPIAFAAEPFNGVSFYYSLTDLVALAGCFLLVRLVQSLHALQQRASAMPDVAAAFLLVKVAGGTRRIHARDILYFKAERDFTRVLCASGEHFVSESLKSLVARSADLGLVRVHKSYAVNIAHVERLSRSKALLGACQVPVGRRHYDALARAWGA